MEIQHRTEGSITGLPGNGSSYEVVEQEIPKMAEGEERELTITLKNSF